jgi:hypothetical protein
MKDMTWGDFKRWMDAGGVLDTDVAHFILVNWDNIDEAKIQRHPQPDFADVMLVEVAPPIGSHIS